MHRDTALVQALHDLGLTQTEADVYLGTLRATTGGPASGYRIARDIGRDPANLGKVMAALVRHGAVRVVQDRPRLYEPVDPAVFTAGIVDHLKMRREEVLAGLANLSPPASAVPILLPDLESSLTQAHRLLESAHDTVFLQTDPDTASLLGPALRAAGERGCQVRILSAAPVKGCGGELTIVPGPHGDEAVSGLQLVVDEEAWLVGTGAADPDDACGYWGRQRPVARALAATLESLRTASGLRCEMAAAAGAGGATVRTPLKFLVRHDKGEPRTG